MLKFIIAKDGTLRYGDVGYHREFLKDRETSCFGGGMYRIDEENKRVILSEISGDFGKPQFDKLEYLPKEWDGYTVCYYQEEVKSKVIDEPCHMYENLQYYTPKRDLYQSSPKQYSMSLSNKHRNNKHKFNNKKRK